MNWSSWSDFFAMGGYALYVWGSVLMMLVLLVGEVAAVRMRRNSLMEMYGRMIRNTRRERTEDKA